MRDILSLKEAILATLSYFDLFDFPLTIAELEEYLYGWSAPREAIEKELNTLSSVSHAHGFYYLQGRGECAELRKEQEKMAHRLWQKARRYRWLLALCPFVRMVAVCNSLAYGNVKATSDIDLFVITADGKLWTARLCMKLLTQLAGMRAHHEKTAGRFCLSFFMSEHALSLQALAHRFDPYLAYWILTMKPLYGFLTHQKFVKTNEEWLALEYFKRPLTPQSSSPRLEKMGKPRLAIALRCILETILSLFGNVLESWAERIQSSKDLYRKKEFPKSDGIIITKNIFKFHEKDIRREIAKKFQEKLGA